MRFTPIYRLPALEGSSTAKEVYEQSWNMALELERVLLDTGQAPVASDLASLVRRINVLEAGGVVGPWTDAVFVNGFRNHPNEAVWGRTQWRIIGSPTAAYLEMRGEVAVPSGAGVDAVMFNLPAAARPPRSLQVLALDNANSTPAIAMVGIRADGAVTLSPPGKAFVNLTVRVPLS